MKHVDEKVKKDVENWRQWMMKFDNSANYMRDKEHWRSFVQLHSTIWVILLS